ncbi:Succinate dehydrogenase assembly factor 1 [Colletotrichum orbiculare MAFF 240422]|uniref:Succinate dehydrogenase assembly factor 1 n=1 Tax=Colletotrichum orbiculare (strain 104-T / ATCC 96160 / CBS 514.97 / LARS 414 / MAFF 240422) TaxID=1213857 RepID=A0A484G929_COLOR|nr:Succinate dehydrogenase assembly factor 1 [Colletotrichum orbiculare MAFF 240422]
MAVARRGLSGLQREVLALYRQCLREIRKKPETTQPHFKTEFEKYIAVDKRDFSVVEHLLRKGRRQLETFSSPSIKDVLRSVSQQSQVSLLASPSRSPKPSSTSLQPPTRTSSRRREVDRFAKQLEIYAQRREAAGKLHINTPTPESGLSLHTVTALLPYQDQFLAAGLAVTSTQQGKYDNPRSPAKESEDEMKPHGRPPLVGIQAEDPKTKVNPGHLQFNGVRSPTSGPSDSAGSATEVAFTQPGALEVAFIDEARPKKADDNGAPPSPTVDAPSKILARWRPVYPQKDGPLIKPGEGTNLRDPRLNTWHGDTAQRPSTHRLARQTEFDDVDEEDLPPNGKPSVAHRKDIKPPIPPKAASRYRPSTKPLQHIRVDANSKGLRKVSQQNAFTEDPKPTAPHGKKALTSLERHPRPFGNLLGYL